MENLVTAKSLSLFYNKKRVFITGHTGFKGSWLVYVLHSLGATTKGYALAPEGSGGLFEYLQRDSVGLTVIDDIRNKKRLRKELLDFAPDIVFHLAAQPLVRRSYEIPAETFEVNVTGTANLLEAATSLPHKCTIVVITTDKVYQNKEKNVLYNEMNALGGHDPYSASKACCELVCDAFRKSFFQVEKYALHQKALATARAGNVIGGGDYSRDRLLPDIINSLSTNTKVLVRNPSAVRPWQHVLEALSGYLILAMLLDSNPRQFSKAYNFGPLPEDHLSVEQVVKKAIAIWGMGEWEDISSPGQPHEAGLLMLDISLALKELNWNPKLNAASAMKMTVDWYKQPEHERGKYTLKQIEEYFMV